MPITMQAGRLPVRVRLSVVVLWGLTCVTFAAPRARAGSVAAPRPKSLWRVGIEDGNPANDQAELVRGQYTLRRSDSPVVTIRSTAEFPQIIGPGQSFVIHVGALPEINLKLCVSIGFRSASGHAYRLGMQERRLRIRMNDHTIWHRGVVDGHARIEAFVPASMVVRAGNVLVIENESHSAAAFDAISLEPYAPGEPVIAALTGAHQLPGTVAGDVWQTVLRLEAPRGAPVGAPGGARPRAPRSLADAYAAARAFSGTQPPEMTDAEASILRRQWETELVDALRRGLLPLVEIRAHGGTEADWRWFAGRFGGIVYAWIVRSPEAAGWIRDSVEGAHIYGHEVSEAFDGMVIRRQATAFGGPIEREAGRIRLRHAGRPPPTLGANLYMPQSLQDVRLQRRNGLFMLETAMQWWMTASSMLIVEGGELGSDFFPGLTAVPSPAWEALRLVFAAGAGTARRAACMVVPDRGSTALADTHWVAVENGPHLVTVLIRPGNIDLERTVRLIVPVPWTGPTHGIQEGVRFHNWRAGNPEVLPAQPLQLTAAAPGGRTGRQASGIHGYTGTSLTLFGFTRVMLWPASAQPPQDRRQSLRSLPGVHTSEPEVLHNVFRLHELLPASGYRYEVLRAPEWSAGPLGGEGGIEARSASRAPLSAWRVADRFHDREQVTVRNAVPWEPKSLYLSLRPDLAMHGFRLFQAGHHTWEGGWGMLVYARARVTGSTLPSLRSSSTSPARLWMGNPSRRQAIDLPIDEWKLIVAPFDGLFGAKDNTYAFHVWPDAREARIIELEVNGFAAIYEKDVNGRRYAPAKVAASWNDDRSQLQLLIEGEPGKPVAHLLRLERPTRIQEAKIIEPEGLRGVQIIHRPEAHILEVRTGPLPDADKGLSAAAARELIPAIHPESSHARILIDLRIER